MNPLNETALEAFVQQIFRIPIYSNAHEDARLTQDTRVIYFAEGYHAVRVFPILTDKSAEMIKEAYREEVQALVQAGELEIVKNLPVSLEDMAKQTARDINPAPVWRLEQVSQTHSEIGGYKLQAIRYATDTITRFPCVMLSYTRAESPAIEVYLIGRQLSAEYDKTLRVIQMDEAKKMALDQAKDKKELEPTIIGG
jgi:uncharacterized protein YdaT